MAQKKLKIDLLKTTRKIHAIFKQFSKLYPERSHQMRLKIDHLEENFNLDWLKNTSELVGNYTDYRRVLPCFLRSPCNCWLRLKRCQNMVKYTLTSEPRSGVWHVDAAKLASKFQKVIQMG